MSLEYLSSYATYAVMCKSQAADRSHNTSVSKDMRGSAQCNIHVLQSTVVKQEIGSSLETTFQ